MAESASEAFARNRSKSGILRRLSRSQTSLNTLPADGAGEVKTVTDLAQLQQEFDSADDRLVVCCFGAEWCYPAEMMKPLIRDLAKKMPENKYLEVDIDKAPDIAQKYEVKSIPLYVFVRDSEALEEKVLGADIDNVHQHIKNISRVVPSEGAAMMAIGHFLKMI